MIPLSEQTAIITGAAQGLGAAIARHFARKGASVILMDYNAEALAETAQSCGERARAITVDLSDASATDTAIAEALEGVEQVDTLIHNAAILNPVDFAAETLVGFRKTLDVGLQAGFQLAHAVWPGMVKAKGGALVFVSSRSGIVGFADEAAYCATKHGLEGLSKSLALAGEPYGIISATITPGMYMRTPMSERNYPDELKAKWVEPDRLAPAFSTIAETRSPAFSGQRLDAWSLSQGPRLP